MAELIFWTAASLLFHTYVFYPFLLVALEAVHQVLSDIRFMRSGMDRRVVLEEEALPTISLVVAAHNEAQCIAEKIRNSLALDYPPEKLQLLIGSDGSDDGTDEIVRSFSDPRVVLVSLPRAGKASVLNRCVPLASGQLVVFSDANTVIDPQALRMLARHFDDSDVGAVCGRLKLIDPIRRDFEESTYWRYESLIKYFEGKRGAVVGANGGLYAIRRRLFSALPSDTIVDDFVIALRVLDERFRVVYDPQAIAIEETTGDYRLEFKRRARIAAGNFQSLRMFPWLLSPTAGFRAFALWSHKVLRWLAPALIAIAFLANLMLLDRARYRLLLAAQVLFYALALAGSRGVFTGTLRRAASIAYYFVTMNWAIVVGFWRFIRHRQQAAWERTVRSTAP